MTINNPPYPYNQLVLPHLGGDNSGQQQQENNQVLQRAFNLLQPPAPSSTLGFLLLDQDIGGGFNINGNTNAQFSVWPDPEDNGIFGEANITMPFLPYTATG